MKNSWITDNRLSSPHNFSIEFLFSFSFLFTPHKIINRQAPKCKRETNEMATAFVRHEAFYRLYWFVSLFFSVSKLFRDNNVATLKKKPTWYVNGKSMLSSNEWKTKEKTVKRETANDNNGFWKPSLSVSSRALMKMMFLCDFSVGWSTSISCFLICFWTTKNAWHEENETIRKWRPENLICAHTNK